MCFILQQPTEVADPNPSCTGYHITFFHFLVAVAVNLQMVPHIDLKAGTANSLHTVILLAPCNDPAQSAEMKILKFACLAVLALRGRKNFHIPSTHTGNYWNFQ